MVKRYYYVAMVLDFILRNVWLYTLVNWKEKAKKKKETTNSRFGTLPPMIFPLNASTLLASLFLLWLLYIDHI